MNLSRLTLYLALLTCAVLLISCGDVLKGLWESGDGVPMKLIANNNSSSSLNLDGYYHAQDSIHRRAHVVFLNSNGTYINIMVQNVDKPSQIDSALMRFPWKDILRRRSAWGAYEVGKSREMLMKGWYFAEGADPLYLHKGIVMHGGAFRIDRVFSFDCEVAIEKNEVYTFRRYLNKPDSMNTSFFDISDGSASEDF